MNDFRDSEPSDLQRFLEEDEGRRLEEIFKSVFNSEENYNIHHWITHQHHFEYLGEKDLTDSEKLFDLLKEVQSLITSKRGRKFLYSRVSMRLLSLGDLL